MKNMSVTYGESMTILRGRVEASKTNVGIAMIQFIQGPTATNFRVLDAELKRYQANTQLVNDALREGKAK